MAEVLSHWRAWLDAWVQRRSPSAKSVTLTQGRIFIVPGRTALGLLVLIAVLFLLGVNFQSSLVYAVCFWLLALLVVNILYTWRNLAGVTLTAVRMAPCFAGEKVVLDIDVACPKKQRKFALQLAWPEEDQAPLDLVHNGTARVSLSHSTTQRGRFQAPRIVVSTAFPTGLAYAWSLVSLDVSALVYPTPHAHPVTQQAAMNAETTEDGREIAGGSSDFSGVRDYRAGDSLRHVHWKKYAQTGQLHTREFVDYAAHDVWLDWDSLPMLDTEARLSHLCSQVLAFHAAQCSYGLKLPAVILQADSGDAHRERCLRALALHGLHDESAGEGRL